MISQSVIERSLYETMRECARTEFDAAERGGWRFDVSGNGAEWCLVAKKGPEKIIRRHRIREELLLAQRYNVVIEEFRDDLRYLVARTRHLRGIVVAVAGKWRKWGKTWPC